MMLSRIANSLFWLGRYLERVEHMSRFTRVNYFASLDAPAVISREYVIESILQMNGYEKTTALPESKALHYIAFDRENANSIINQVTAARDNARAARTIISTELFEAINRFYHFVINYNIELYTKTHLYDFTHTVSEHSIIIKGKVDSTLIHDDCWSIIMTGIYLEKAQQIIRAIDVKINDDMKLTPEITERALVSHHLATLLRGLEAFDMSRKYFRRAPDLENSMEFLLLNPDFPRSVLRCLEGLRYHLGRISRYTRPPRESVEFAIRKAFSELEYREASDIVPNLEEFLKAYTALLDKLASRIESELFNF